MISKPLRIGLYITAGVFLVVVAIFAILAIRFQPVAKDYVISALRERYGSAVELGNLNIALFPSVHATGDSLTLRIGGRQDVPPMVTVRHFTLDAHFIGFFRSPRHISRLRLEGLELHIPPHSESSGTPQQTKEPKASFVLDEVIADGAKLETLPKDASKDPLVFDIRQLVLHGAGVGQPMTFHAELINPKPPGFIHSDGSFGPWKTAEPGDTAVSGRYKFQNADLSVFKGIAGMLSSTGKYQGTLDRIEVRGEADVPKFSLRIADRPMPLHTEFQATVDGTNGNTVLHPVHAKLGSSTFDVSGAIERQAVEKHKTIRLEARSVKGHLEDFLRLAVKGPNAPMTGGLGFITTVVIPPGETVVIDRLQLDGGFSLNQIRFTSADIEQKIASLSHRAQGEPEAAGPVTADFKGRFQLRNGQLRLPDLQFTVPGAQVNLAGDYALRSGALDFTGTAKLDATVSQMTTGVKRVLLKPIDPLFKHDSTGAVVPITIKGTRGQPSFGLDIGRVMTRK